jgi:hypothetical protein
LGLGGHGLGGHGLGGHGLGGHPLDASVLGCGADILNIFNILLTHQYIFISYILINSKNN